MLSLDTHLFLFLNTVFAHPWLDAFFRCITETGNWVVPLGLAVVLTTVRVARTADGRTGLAAKPHWRRVLIAVALCAVVVGITDPVAARVIKPLVHRYRPCHPDHLVEGGRYLLGLKRSLSFPSNHAANVFGLATLLTCFFRRRWFWFFLPAALVAFSRIYLGVHYPLDVLGGAAVGVLVGLAVYWLYRRVTKTARRKGGSRTALTACPPPPGTPRSPRPS